MRTIVVPVDATENSINAAHYAADMALAIDADLHLLHVIRILVSPTGYVYEEMEKAGKALLEDLSKELKERTRSQVGITTLLEPGSVEIKIAEVCQRIEPFIVVMGAPQGSFTRALFGSPILDAARTLPYPVLIIPANTVFRRIRRIALAGQVKDIAGKMPVTVSFLKQLQALFDSRFDIVHVEMNKEDKEMEQIFGLYRWQKALEELNPELHIMHSPSVLEGVTGYISEHSVEWLMVFPARHGLLSFHRSQSKPLIMHCTVPVMSISEAVVPERAEEVRTDTGSIH